MYVHDTIRDFTSRRFNLDYVHVESIWLQVKTGISHFPSFHQLSGLMIFLL